MARTILTEFALFLTPFAIYAIALTLMKRSAREKEHWGAKVVGTLAAAGLVLVAISLVFLSRYGGFETGKQYTPAQFKDGKLVPGETK
jgi:hypothetical protein